jgi:CheY-like chemotaxis protein
LRSEEVKEKAFDPFYTTKSEGAGTGLGLSMVHGFIKQSGGHIKIYSESGVGTTIRMYLPRTRRSIEERSTGILDRITGGKETVLLVEDDDDVRATNAGLLAELRYNVIEARDADTALEIVESGAPIDLLFTDVVLPGKLKSPELARLAQIKIPKLKVLYTSGYTGNAIVHGGHLDPSVELLSKPFSRDDLARKIIQILHPRASG